MGNIGRPFKFHTNYITSDLIYGRIEWINLPLLLFLAVLNLVLRIELFSFLNKAPNCFTYHHLPSITEFSHNAKKRKKKSRNAFNSYFSTIWIKKKKKRREKERFPGSELLIWCRRQMKVIACVANDNLLNYVFK